MLNERILQPLATGNESSDVSHAEAPGSFAELDQTRKLTGIGQHAMDPTELDADRTPRLHLRDPTEPVPQDFDGRPLEGLLGAPMESGTFLRLAIGIASALGEVHQSGLVHRDVKPANILVNPGSGEVRFTGFGLASRLAREHQRPEPPESIAGTLAYMAPEQTGRMNRATDSRSDLYGLGVVLYEMLTGAPPFTASDPMELIHCHIARQPAPPSDRAGRRGACHGWAGSVLLRHVRDLLGVDERFVVRLGLWRRRLGLPADATRTFGARPPLRLLGFSQLNWVLEPALHRHAVFG